MNVKPPIGGLDCLTVVPVNRSGSRLSQQQSGEALPHSTRRSRRVIEGTTGIVRCERVEAGCIAERADVVSVSAYVAAEFDVVRTMLLVEAYKEGVDIVVEVSALSLPRLCAPDMATRGNMSAVCVS